ncbi:hypothetical protein [Streptosporangium pseudovulgare]|uniref:Zinc-ribbon domain-containing protein n=1 Tax=Streptosporangium pseudovulgare TaxID=35765 RepID=A0ABQ2RHZ8_9ACTN|nr:hypothetical protein [Streptosporangium pseudovulgare]GGQ30018.1 hypothetical protein GCM10010140_70160 [Streptosporangium pseudovulgare]
MAARGDPSVAASDEWVDENGVRMPAGDAHAWWQGTNQTLCGLALSRSRLRRFAHVPWPDAFPETGGAAEEIRRVCPKCRAASGHGRSGRSWTRTDPRP